MMKYGWTRHTVYHLNREQHERRTSYAIELWKQPLHRWLIAKFYHWYSWKIHKVPGFKKLEKWLWKRYEDHHDGDELFLYIPISNRQDLRCYDLCHKRQTVLARLELTKEDFDAIGHDDGE